MRSVNNVTLVLVAIASTPTVVDAAMWAMTGRFSFLTQTDSPMLEWALRLVFMAASVGIIVVLVRNGSVIDAGRKSRTELRLLIIPTSATYLVFDTAWAISGVEVGELWQDPGGSFPWWFTVSTVFIGGIGLTAPAVLGITMLAQGDRSPAAWLLTTAVAVHAVSYLGPAALGSPWATLAYTGVVMNLGLALLGASQPRKAPHREPSAVTD
jgi:hypothetical protein